MILVGGAITILKNLEKYEFVKGKDDIPYYGKQKMFLATYIWYHLMLNYMQDQIRISSTTSLSAMKMARPLLVIAVSPLLLRRQETIRNLCESSCPTLSDFSDPNPWNFSTCGCASACCAQGCFLIKLYAVLGATKVWWAARSLMRWQERQWQSMN